MARVVWEVLVSPRKLWPVLCGKFWCRQGNYGPFCVGSSGVAKETMARFVWEVLVSPRKLWPVL